MARSPLTTDDSRLTTRERLRAARPDEAAAISELAMRSKGHWGYDAAFLEACREELTLTPEDIAASTVFVHDRGDALMGFYLLVPGDDGAAVLDDLFVDPSAIEQGVGRTLWEHAVRTAEALHYTELLVQSDPHSRVGGRESGVGSRESGGGVREWGSR